MSRKGQNCPVSCLKKHINWKWWKVDSRWKQEWRRVHSTKLTTKLLLEEDCRGTTQWHKPLEEVCYLGNRHNMYLSTECKGWMGHELHVPWQRAIFFSIQPDPTRWISSLSCHLWKVLKFLVNGQWKFKWLFPDWLALACIALTRPALHTSDRQCFF